LFCAVLGILYLLIYLNIIDLAIDLPSEEASVSYPECILWATVCSVSYCAFIGTSHKLLPALHRPFN